MPADPKTAEAARILRGLKEISGGGSVKIAAKKFPRRPLADGGLSYTQEEHSFPVDRVPQEAAVPDGMDEISITLHGVLDDTQSTIALLAQVNGVLSRVETGARWDTRTFVGDCAKRPRDYRVTFFTDAFGVVPSA
jgi:hypothetical protein